MRVWQAYTWEANYTRSWETVQEDEAGSLQGAVEEYMARGRRRRSVSSKSVNQVIYSKFSDCWHLLLLYDELLSDISFCFWISRRQ